LAHFDAAVVTAHTLLDVGDELGNFVHRLDARVVLSTIAVVHGDLDLARNIVAVAQDELGPTDAVHAPGMILARARIAAAELDFDEGVRLLKPLLANDSTLRTYWPRLLDQMRLSAGIAVAAGDRTFAQETVERAASAARRNPGVASFRGVALQVRGFVMDDLGSLEQAVELLGRSPRPVILATALTDQGALLLRQGKRGQAATPLTQAFEIYRELRAAPAQAHVQGLLTQARPATATGRQRGSKPVSGWGSLTDMESVVARLVGEGHTNRATAERLGISTNTVAAHLKSVFVKMDVHSRVQLVNAMPGA
jgi:DNA-binding CsgD family transcriptional regulator